MAGLRLTKHFQSSCVSVTKIVTCNSYARSFGRFPAHKTSDTDQTISPELSSSMVGRDFLNLKHFKTDEIKQLLWTAKDLKSRIKDNEEVFQPLAGKTAALIFQKRSTRTRLSSELGFARLGGHAAFLGPEDIHLGVSESVQDTARVLTGMADVILAQADEQNFLETLANEASIPVISGLSDLLHPLQTLADFLTIQEHFGSLHGRKIAWVGDGNNILHSLMYGCAKMGVDLGVATPVGYEADADVTIEAMKIAGTTGASFQFGNNPLEAVYRADAIITDTWVRMGQEEEEKKRLVHFNGYQVNRKMLREAGGDWVFLHCLPRKQEEVTDDVFYGPESLVWQEAGNRMWTVMSVMLHLLQPYTPTIPMPKFVRG